VGSCYLPEVEEAAPFRIAISISLAVNVLDHHQQPFIIVAHLSEYFFDFFLMVSELMPSTFKNNELQRRHLS
jgi:hypothetical protein